MRIRSDEYMLVRGLHTPIISKEVWDITQEKIKGNPSSRTGLNRELQNPLAGLVFCKKCGYSLVRVKNSKRGKERKKRRKYNLDKVGINSLLREAKTKVGVTNKKIAEFLDVSKYVVDSWFLVNIDRVNYSDVFSEKWYELKFILEIDTDKYDKQIMTYVDPPPLNDTFMCSNSHCDMVAASLQRIERGILDDLKKQLEHFNYYVDNYEKEIIKERVDKQKMITKINNKLEGLKQERKNLLRARNREEYSYEDYLELKADIEAEIEELNLRLEEYENDDENDTLTKYKKAIPKLKNCLDEYNNISIPQKNENLKSIIARITYSKTKRLNWRKDDEDDLELVIELKL